ncbi:hypothetical protein KBTX_00718 [wastewater metagenome]|uniref:S-adenosyl-L-methionine-dependent methyltransferase n=2 Tax=unclassified sequences TaxID=12908 RepID=A0A5B8R6Y2_9ZZZZ|nr:MULTISPECIES: SAM-dependent methyltransferase [Arhodomonas]QEA04410.1 hypothetical protein KBTEX_00718 [uncultured organism]
MTSPVNAPVAGQESPSARRVAIARAVHQLLDEPLVLEDRLALPVLGAETAQTVRDDPFPFNDLPARTMRAAVVARTRLAEDALHDAVNEGVRQCVVLGAGLDTLACRNPYADAGLRCFEVDVPGAAALKRARLAGAGVAVPASAVFVSADLCRDDPVAALAADGFDAAAPACVVCMGVTPYLPRPAVLDLLAALAACAPGSRIVFDHRVEAGLLTPMERLMAGHAAESFAAMGEPWLSDFQPAALVRYLSDLGFTDVAEVDPAALNARYFHRRRDGLQTAGGGFRILTARR